MYLVLKTMYLVLKMLSWVLLTCGLAHLASTAFAAPAAGGSGTTYYVAPAAGGSGGSGVSGEGSDDNPGTAERPFATVQQAINRAHPGDTVLVRAGRYHETVSFPRSGAKGKPITLAGEPGATLDGGIPFRGWELAPEVGKRVFKKKEAPFPARVVVWEGKSIVVLNPKGGIFREREKIEVALGTDPDDNEGGGKKSNPTPNWWDGIEAVYTYLNDTHYIHFRGGNDPDKEDLSFAPYGGAVVLVEDQDHIVIRGLTIRTGSWGVALRGANDCTVEDNFISATGTYNVAISKGASRNHVRNNQLTQAYVYPDFGHPWRPAIHARMWGMVKGYMWGDTMGVRMDDHGDDNHMYGNHVYRHFDGISEGDGGGSGTRVYNNIVQNIADDGLAPHGIMVDSQWYDNVVIEGGNGAVSIAPGNRLVGPCYIYRNRFYFTQLDNSSEGCMHFKNPFPATGKLYIYHNTYAGNGPSVSVNQNWSEVPTSANVLFVNNIFSSKNFYKDSWTPRAQGGVGHFDHNWVGGARADYLAGKPHFGPGNVVAPGELLWPDLTNPSFFPPKGFAGRGIGLDVSRPFTLFGKEHPALPGTQGWYQSGSVDPGVLQASDRPAIPAAPTGLTARRSADQVALTWKDNASNETHYLIDRSEDGQVFTTVARVAADSTSYVDRQYIKPGRTYHYRVWAIQVATGAWFSPYSNVASAPETAPGK